MIFAFISPTVTQIACAAQGAVFHRPCRPRSEQHSGVEEFFLPDERQSADGRNRSACGEQACHRRAGPPATGRLGSTISLIESLRALCTGAESASTGVLVHPCGKSCKTFLLQKCAEIFAEFCARLREKGGTREKSSAARRGPHLSIWIAARGECVGGNAVRSRIDTRREILPLADSARNHRAGSTSVDLSS